MRGKVKERNRGKVKERKREREKGGMVGSIQLSCRRKGMSRLRMLFSRPSVFYEQPKEVEWPATKMLHNCSRLSGQKYNRRLSTFFNQHFEFFFCLAKLISIENVK